MSNEIINVGKDHHKVVMLYYKPPKTDEWPLEKDYFNRKYILETIDFQGKC